MEWLFSFDQEAFLWVNTEATSNLLDNIMPVIRNKYIWAPLYIFLIAFMIYNFGRKGLIFVGFAFLTIFISDTTSSQLIKKTVKRPRPCRTEVLVDQLELRARCGGGYSFTSSHATNHMALASFIFFSLGSVFRRTKWFWILWALSIGYAQIYVGVHYPLDVLAGFLLGYFIGYVNYRLADMLGYAGFT